MQQQHRRLKRADFGPLMHNHASPENPKLRPLAGMAHDLTEQQIFDNRLNDRAYATNIFKWHIEDVQQTIPANRLLTFEVAEGREPRCTFLGVPIPETPFPNTSSIKDFNRQR